MRRGYTEHLIKLREFYQYVLEHYQTESREAIAEKFNTKPKNVDLALGRMRRFGVYIPVKEDRETLFNEDFVSKLKSKSLEMYGEPKELEKEKECAICGKKFYRNKESSSVWKRRQVCSRNCGKKDSKNTTVNKREGKDIDFDTVNFNYCQNKYCPKPERRFVDGTGIKSNGLIFCSQNCVDDFGDMVL